MERKKSGVSNTSSHLSDSGRRTGLGGSFRKSFTSRRSDRETSLNPLRTNSLAAPLGGAGVEVEMKKDPKTKRASSTDPDATSEDSPVTDTSGLFKNMKDFNEDISSWNISKVEKMSEMFTHATSFNREYIKGWPGRIKCRPWRDKDKKFTNEELRQAVKEWEGNCALAEVLYGHISGWDVSEVSDMRHLFKYMKTFTDDISAWDVGNVKNMQSMFNGASAFNGSIGRWNTGKVENMSHMFENAEAFDSDIGSWNTAKVQNMERTFYGAKVFNQDIGSWNTANTTSMDCLFYGASAFNEDYIKDWANKPKK